jgi:hypothetical protein
MKDLKHSVGSIKAQSYTGSTDKSAGQIEKGANLQTNKNCKQKYKCKYVNKFTCVNEIV